jgi:glycosyltransferase involved in cell wall biosynthesis
MPSAASAWSQFGPAPRNEPVPWRQFMLPMAAAAPPASRHVGPDPEGGDAGAEPGVPMLLSVAIAPGLGGSMRSLATVLSGLEGWQRVVACPAGTTFTEFLDERALCDEFVPLPQEGRWRVVARARAAARIATWTWRHRRRLSAIHANGLAERNLVTVAAALVRVPVVVWMHEWSVSPWARRIAPLLRVLVPRTQFAAVSEQARDTLVEAGLASRDQITVVPNPIDPVDVVGATRTPHDRPTIAYLGTPARYKGFHLLPDLIRALGGEPVTWLVYSGPLTMLPEVWAELAGLDEIDIEIPGKLADVGQAYVRCDIVICPSLHESFGRVAAEAMCNGIPVVASDLPPLRDLLGDNEAGLLVPPGSVDALAAALRRLLADADLCRQLGEVGRSRAVRFRPEPIVASLTALYGVGT